MRPVSVSSAAAVVAMRVGGATRDSEVREVHQGGPEERVPEGAAVAE